MNRFVDLVTKGAREMDAYLPRVQARPLGPEPQIVRLDSNENPLGPSPRAVEVMQRGLADAHLYPDNECGALAARLSKLHQIPQEQILVTAGSTGMLSLLCHTLLAPGLNAITSAKSFIIYGMAVRATGAELVETPTHNDGFDLTAILNAINDRTRLVLLANPNNPTGTLLDAGELARFVRKVPNHVVVVLDEAYYEFAVHFAKYRQVEYSQSLTYLRQGASVVVLRTFSKAHGLAGLRIGYGLGPAELMSFCASMQDTYSVSSVAQAAALAALDDVEHITRSVSHNAENAQMLEGRLSELGVRIVPTWANFIYCELKDNAAEFARRLREGGVSVRPLAAWGAPTCVRVSVGTAEQNDAFLKAMSKVRRLYATET